MAVAPWSFVTTVFWISDHEPAKPSWDCDTCAAAWPCAEAREHLAAYLGQVALAIHMCERLDDAAGDLRHVPPPELFRRFLSWTRTR